MALTRRRRKEVGGEGASAHVEPGQVERALGQEHRPCTQVSLREEKPALQSTVFSFIRRLSTEKEAAQSLKACVLRW